MIRVVTCLSLVLLAISSWSADALAADALAADALAAAALAADEAVTDEAVADAASSDRQLAHMVFFKIADQPADAKQKLAAACKKYLVGHSGTVYFSVGVRAQEMQRDVNDKGFDVALHLVFKNKAAHDQYSAHPRHLKFIEENQQLWSDVRVFDSFLSASAQSATARPATTRPVKAKPKMQIRKLEFKKVAPKKVGS